MKKHLQDAVSGSSILSSKLKRRMALTALAVGSLYAESALAQINYRPADAVNTTTTYTDLGTNGTAITVANNDDASSAPIPIGFTFNYNGQAFTNFVLNTNGYIKLGTAAPSGPTIFSNLWAAPDSNIIAAASGVDLEGAANQTTNPTEFRVNTTGTAPNRVTTIQFENLTDKATVSGSTTIPAQFTTMNFQIKLYEGSNNIEFVYGTWTANNNTPTGQPFLIGLKGTTGAEINRLFAAKPSSSFPWAQTTFERSTVQGGVTYLASHFVRNTFLPTAGRTYRFVPYAVPANDLSVQAVYAQGKMALSSGNSHVVKALIENTGSAAITNRTVSLDISGANSFSSSVTLSLAPGQDSLVEFMAFTPTNVGSNFVEVTVPSDDENSNNVKDVNVMVTSNTLSNAIYPSNVSTPINFQTALRPLGNPTTVTEGALLSRFRVEDRVELSDVRIYLADFQGTNIIGKTVFATVRDSSGMEVARSANLVIGSTDVNMFKSFPLTSMAIFEDEEFYVGLEVPSNTATTTFFPLAAQTVDVPASIGASFREDATAAFEEDSDYLFLIEADVTTVTGVKDKLANNAVSVYPNPTSGTVFIKLNDGLTSKNLGVEVRNLQGQVVYTQAVEDATGKTEVNLSKLAAGMYLMQINTDDKVAVKRIVIQ